MKMRTLGKSGIEVSEIGLGCWQLGGDFGPLGEDRAQQILAAAERCGITFWDTADVYGGGDSEARIARFRSRHDSLSIVATKVGRDASLFPDRYTRKGIRASIEGSLKRLDTDCLDLVQLHCVPAAVLQEGEIFTWLEDLQAAGLIRHFGASVESLDDALLAMRHPGLASLQIILNLFRQDAVGKLLPLAQQKGVGIIARLPLASGVLAGRMNADTVFAPTDHRNYNRHGEFFSQGETFSGIPFEIALERVEHLRTMLPAGLSMAQMAMRWLLDQPAVSTVITGASTPRQVVENATVSALPRLSDELHARLSFYYWAEVAPHIVVPV